MFFRLDEVGKLRDFVMCKKLVLVLISFFLMFSLISFASATLTVGVKAGDWIEYQVTFTGTPPDPSHSVVEANMTVLNVSGSSIQVNIISTLSNGTQLSTNSTLNLQTGQLIDNFIIPANLQKGDRFYDSAIGSNITITGSQQGIYGGATRTVINATSGSNTYVWDQVTGVDVEGFSSGEGYTMHTLASGTNIWQSQVPEFNVSQIGSLVIIGAIIAVSVTVIVIHQKKK
jgi:hypothetical protein